MTGPIRTRLQPIEEATAPTTAGDTLQWNGSAYVWAAGGGGGGAPTTATYVTLSTDATLTNERVLTAGSGITITDNGAGNTVVIAATGSGGTFGQATATFSGGADSVKVTVSDAGVTAASKIVPTIALVGRDVDEMELAPVVVAVGSISAGVGFDLIVVSLDGDAEGAYTVNYTRS